MKTQNAKTKALLDDILPLLNEKQKRMVVGVYAEHQGHGGISNLSQLTGMSRTTIRKGIQDKKELNPEAPKEKRIRKKGGGRKQKKDHHPELPSLIEKIIETEISGNPENFVKWVYMSSRAIAKILLKDYGIEVSYSTVHRIAKDLDYFLKGNKKNLEKDQSHPHRNEQYEFINSQAKKFQEQGCPTISVDTKKKELVGNFANKGKTWTKKGKPIETLSHDFKGPENGVAVPYGIYDPLANKGYVNVGMSADTGEFSVASIRKWWNGYGKKMYPKSTDLFICPDSGGSNGYRLKLWKYELQKLSNESNLTIHVSHLPPGISKWNKVEHRLFSFISMNWRGRPLKDFATIVNLISNTKTEKGLTVEAYLDKKIYEKGIKISKEQMKEINITPNEFHGEWNYSIAPNT